MGSARAARAALTAIGLGLGLVGLSPSSLAAPAPHPPAADGARPTGAPTETIEPVTAGADATELDAALRRIAELEDRVAALEGQLDAEGGQDTAAATQEAPPPAIQIREEAPPLLSRGGTREQLRLGTTVIAAGEVVQDAVALSGPVHVHGTVEGNAVGIGGDVHVHAGGRVLGDAVSIGGAVSVAPGGVVEGDRVTLGASAVGPVPTAAPAAGAGGFASQVARQVASMLSLAAAGVLLIAFFPQAVSNIAEASRQRPFWHGLAGMILTGVLGAGAVVLTITVLGLPLAAALVLLLGAAWLLGFVGVCLGIGERLPAGARPRPAWMTFLAGAGLVGLASLIPVAGPLLIVLVGFLAVGSALVSRLGTRRDPDAF